MAPADYEKYKHLHREKVMCVPCGVEICRYGMKSHLKCVGHLRAIGEVAPKPAKPEPKPRGRPKKEGPLFAERNPDYANSPKWCDVCQLHVRASYITTHRGTRKHQEAAEAARCVPCASASEAPTSEAGY